MVPDFEEIFYGDRPEMNCNGKGCAAPVTKIIVFQGIEIGTCDDPSCVLYNRELIYALGRLVEGEDYYISDND